VLPLLTCLPTHVVSLRPQDNARVWPHLHAAEFAVSLFEPSLLRPRLASTPSPSFPLRPSPVLFAQVELGVQLALMLLPVAPPPPPTFCAAVLIMRTHCWPTSPMLGTAAACCGAPMGPRIPSVARAHGSLRDLLRTPPRGLPTLPRPHERAKWLRIETYRYVSAVDLCARSQGKRKCSHCFTAACVACIGAGGMGVWDMHASCLKQLHYFSEGLHHLRHCHLFRPPVPLPASMAIRRP